MKVVVFGSTGQIGNAVVRALAKRDSGYRVCAVKRESSQVVFPENVSAVLVKRLDRESFRASLAGADHAIYAIGSPEQWVGNQEYFHRINVGLLQEFLSAIVDFPGLSVTYISTYEVFAARDGVCSESNGFVEKGPTPYYQSMIDGLRLVRKHAGEHGTRIIYIHPAAMYGGLNTGFGITNFLLNLKARNYLGSPSMFPGRFPAVHVDSLASAVAAALERGCFGEGFNVSDGYVSLRDLAEAAKRVYPRAYRPVELPAWLVRLSAHLMDFFANTVTKRPPILSAVQVLYITKSFDMDCSKAKRMLGWSPMSFDDGVLKLYGEPREKAGRGG